MVIPETKWDIVEETRALTKDYELTPWTDWPLDAPTTGTEAK